MGIGKVLGYGALITGLGVGAYFAIDLAYNTYSAGASSIVKGKVIEASFSGSSEDYALIKDPTLGEVRVNFITVGLGYRVTGCGNEFQGDAEKLKSMITAGKSLEVRVKEDEGIERTACKLLRIDTPETPNTAP